MAMAPPPEFNFYCDKLFCDATDFIPGRCGFCKKIFCGAHIQYSDHDCPNFLESNRQEVICPLCETTVDQKAVYSLELNLKVHVDQNCPSSVAEARRKWVCNLIRSSSWK